MTMTTTDRPDRIASEVAGKGTKAGAKGAPGDAAKGKGAQAGKKKSKKRHPANGALAADTGTVERSSEAALQRQERRVGWRAGGAGAMRGDVAVAHRLDLAAAHGVVLRQLVCRPWSWCSAHAPGVRSGGRPGQPEAYDLARVR